MTSRSPGPDEAKSAGAPPGDHVDGRPGSLPIPILAAWCGLVAGLAEVVLTILKKQYVDINRFYGMTRHFVWLVPLANFLIFAALGTILAPVVRRGERGRRAAMRVLATLTLLPPFLAAFPRIYGAAGLLLMMGVGTRLAPALERRASGFARAVRLTFPVAAGLPVILAAACWASDRLGERREASQPLPPPDSPNVLLIVLDTVAAGHLSLLGYDRPTSPTLEELAGLGVNFERAQVTASWTLPSHASMLTGRWPHELSAGWLTPLDAAFPTVAEYLGSRGYATAGFAANLAYCASDSGLARGFTTYRDYTFPALTALYTAELVDRVVDGIQGVESVTTYATGFPLLRAPADGIWQLFGDNRKGARVVNREFLDWLSARQRPDRPFFAFLNFYDAHYPYQLPPKSIHRFGAPPVNDRELEVARDWVALEKHGPSPRQVAYARDCYDDCVANLDEGLGELIDELRRRQILEHTWVILTADHGESFGEHPGIFLHGKTLFQAERHVPLVIVPPGGAPSPRVVREPVSLRDLAATIVDLAGLDVDSPFPGGSLVRFWNSSSLESSLERGGGSPALSELQPEIPPDLDTGRVDAAYWPIAALIEGDWSYFRREADGGELLFNLSTDAGELHNLADDPARRPMLERMRQALGRFTAGPLTPDRFKP